MDPLAEMFRHHAWATDTLIDVCAGLPAPLLNVTAPGTYGDVLDTLVHLISADQGYLKHLTGVDEKLRVREGMRPSLDDLKTAFASQARRWQALLPRVAERDIELPGNEQYEPIPHAVALLVVQAIHHGNDHRTQICTVLSAAGVAPPDLDEWAHWASTHP